MKNRLAQANLPVALAACFLFSNIASSMTLQQAVESALHRDQSVAIAAIQVDIAREKLVQARARMRPSVDGDVSEGKLWERTTLVDDGLAASQAALDSDLPRRSLQLTLSQSIYSGGSFKAAYGEAAFLHRAAGAASQSAVINTTLKVIGEFIGVLDAEELLKLASARSASAKGDADEKAAQFKQGAAGRGDLALSNGALSDAQADVSSKAEALAIARSILARDTGEPIGELVLPDEGPPLPSDFSEAEQIVDATNPDILQKIYESDAAQHGVAAARGEMRPQLTVEGVAEREQGSTEDVRSEEIAGFLIRLRIPFYAGGSKSSMLTEAREEADIAELKLSKTKDDAAASLFKAWSDHETSSKLMEKYRSEVDQEQIACEGVAAEISAGSKTFADFLDVSDKLYQAREQLQVANDNSFYSRYEISAVLGRLDISSPPRSKDATVGIRQDAGAFRVHGVPSRESVTSLGR